MKNYWVEFLDFFTISRNTRGWNLILIVYESFCLFFLLFMRSVVDCDFCLIIALATGFGLDCEEGILRTFFTWFFDDLWLDWDFLWPVHKFIWKSEKYSQKKGTFFCQMKKSLPLNNLDFNLHFLLGLILGTFRTTTASL